MRLTSTSLLQFSQARGPILWKSLGKQSCSMPAPQNAPSGSARGLLVWSMSKHPDRKHCSCSLADLWTEGGHGPSRVEPALSPIWTDKAPGGATQTLLLPRLPPITRRRSPIPPIWSDGIHRGPLQGFFQQSGRRANAETAVKVAGATAKHCAVVHGKSTFLSGTLRGNDYDHECYTRANVAYSRATDLTISACPLNMQEPQACCKFYLPCSTGSALCTPTTRHPRPLSRVNSQ